MSRRGRGERGSRLPLSGEPSVGLSLNDPEIMA